MQLSEYRDWFITPEGSPLVPIVPGDTPQNQEVPNASKEKIVDAVTIGTIFLEDNEPSQDNYLKLMKSTTFKLNQSDRAKDSDDVDYLTPVGDIVQGLVTVANNSQAISRDDGIITTYTRVPRTHHLTSASDRSQTISDSNINIDLIPSYVGNIVESPLNLGITTRSDYQPGFSSPFITWYETSLNHIKTYIDTVDVTAGAVTLSGTPSAITINKTNASGVNTNLFEVTLNLQLSTDDTLAGDSDTTAVSESAVKGYVDTQVVGIASKAEQADLDIAEARITVLEGASAAEKADKTLVDALIVTVDGKAGIADNETITGNWTFSNVIAAATAPTAGNHLTNKSYVDTSLLNYDTTVVIDGKLDVERARIAANENNITSIQNDISSNYYTKAEVDALLALKSEITHTHPTLYQPLVSPAFSGAVTLKGASRIEVSNGVVTSIVI